MVATVQDFRRDERFAVLVGGASLGILAGMGAAFALGRTGAWPLLFAAPVFLLAAYLAVATFRDALDRRAIGCAMAAGLVALSLLTWPALALIFPMSTAPFWIAPAVTLASMVLLASCWTGAQGAMYRLSGEAASICAIAGFLGLTQIMT
ncbi:MAG: hypothetical protein AB7P97_09010 [Hyphomonadaceae bacterium]